MVVNTFPGAGSLAIAVSVNRWFGWIPRFSHEPEQVFQHGLRPIKTRPVTSLHWGLVQVTLIWP